jgi:hypothetical protein
MAVTRPNPGVGRPLGAVPSLPVAARRLTRGGASASRKGEERRRALPVLRVLRWPALVTLGVTLLRLVGELRDWSPDWFSRLPGGGLSPIGIAWLVPFVGLYCGWQLQRLGFRTPSPWLALGVPIGALALSPTLPWLANRMHATSWTLHLGLWAISSLFVAAAAASVWLPLGRLLIVYALLARAPVVLVMGVAMWRRWGTHYDAVPPGFPSMTIVQRWLWIGLLPQATIWIALTIAVGAVFGVLGCWLAPRIPGRDGGSRAPLEGFSPGALPPSSAP